MRGTQDDGLVPTWCPLLPQVVGDCELGTGRGGLNSPCRRARHGRFGRAWICPLGALHLSTKALVVESVQYHSTTNSRGKNATFVP